MSLLDIAVSRVKQNVTPQPFIKGNIDTSKRKVLNNLDGSISTESSISIGTDQGEVLIPTVVDGVRLPTEAAINHYYKTGRHLGIFKTTGEANTFAEQLHLRQQERYR